MPCTITITALDANESPLQNQVVTAKPSVAARFQLVSSVWSEVQYGYRSATTDATGTATLSLPWPSVCDPSTLQWVITDPTGAKYVGIVPEGISGPLTLKTLKDTYGWGLAGVNSYLSPIVAVQGPQGPAGAIAGAVYNVMDNGAKNNGTDITGTTAAVQATINQGWATGIPVYFPAGEYALGNLTLPVGDDGTDRALTLLGAASNEIYSDYGVSNAYGTRLRFTQTDGSTFLSAISTTGSIRHPTYRFENLTLIGPDTGGAGSPVGGTCLRISGTAVANVFTRNVNIKGFRASGSCGIWLDNCEDGHLADTMILHCDTDLKLTGSSNANTFTNVSLQLSDTYGLYVNLADSNTFVGGLIQSNKKTGLYMNGAVGWNFLTTHFENNNSSGTVGHHAIQIIGSGTTFNEFISFQRCRYSGATAHNDIYLAGVSTGKNDHITFDRGYNGGQIAPLIVIADQWSQYTEVRELVDPNASPAQITDAGTGTRICWRNQESVGGSPFPMTPQPADRGYKSWTFDPRMSNGLSALTTQTVFLERVDIAAPITISQIDVLFSAAGATLTAGQSLIGIYGSAGALLYTSADQSTAWSSGSGIKSVTSVNTAVTSPFIWVAILCVGTTMPTLARLSGQTAAAANTGVTVGTSVAAHLTTTGTSLTASFTPGGGSMTQDAVQYWVGIK